MESAGNEYDGNGQAQYSYDQQGTYGDGYEQQYDQNCGDYQQAEGQDYYAGGQQGADQDYYQQQNDQGGSQQYYDGTQNGDQQYYGESQNYAQQQYDVPQDNPNQNGDQQYNDDAQNYVQPQNEQNGDQQYYSGEQNGDQQYYNGEQNGDQQYYNGEQNGDQQYYNGEQNGDQQYYNGEQNGDQQYYNGEQNGDQQYYSGEQNGDQQYYNGEQNGDQQNYVQPQIEQNGDQKDYDQSQSCIQQQKEFTQDANFSAQERGLDQHGFEQDFVDEKPSNEINSIQSKTKSNKLSTHKPKTLPVPQTKISSHSAPQIPASLFESTLKSSPRPKPKFVPKAAYVPDPNFSEAELELTVKQVLSLERPPANHNIIMPTYKYVHHMMQKCADESEYDRAAQYTRASEFLRAFAEISSKEKIYENEINENMEKAQVARSQFAEIKNKWDQRIRNQKETQQKLLKDLIYRNEQELANFEAKWANPDYITQYNKPSAKLLNLRNLEQSFAAAKMFEKAKDVKKQIEELIAQETEESRQRAISDMKKQYQTLAAKHKHAIDCFNQYAEKERISMESKKEREINGWELHVRRMENRNTTVSKVRPFEISLMSPSRPLKKNFTRSAPLLSVGALNMKSIIKSPSIYSPRRKL